MKQVVDSIKTYSIFTPSTTLADNTWEQIALMSESGTANTIWSVGDEKNIVVDGETLTLVIMGFNHDDLTSGGKAGITFGLKNLMATTRQMNPSGVKQNIFTDSAMYSWLQSTLLPSLPSDLQGVIKFVDKKTSAGNTSTTINTNSMKLFLFAEVEVWGSVTNSVVGEGTQYVYFENVTDKVKHLSNGDGSSAGWWERSPWSASKTDFCCVYPNGNIGRSPASTEGYGVCFAFCV